MMVVGGTANETEETTMRQMIYMGTIGLVLLTWLACAPADPGSTRSTETPALAIPAAESSPGEQAVGDVEALRSEEGLRLRR